MHIINAESAHTGPGENSQQNLESPGPFTHLCRIVTIPNIATHTARLNKDVIALPARFDPGLLTPAGPDCWYHKGPNAF